MAEKEVGRLIYIEPNDIPKETLNFSKFTQAALTEGISNITWNPEDLNIYVDLQVICPNRTDCGKDPLDEGNLNLNKHKYVSLLEGVKLNKNDKYGSLTTNYTNISYSEILNSSVSDREALGISSIDITFDAHFYPRVTMNFVDVRGYSLFMPAEEVYETELRHEAATNEATADLYDKPNRTYSHFFNSIFHFPYPRFILTVKGVYGTKVSFILAVDTFKSSLNSHTGNFDVVITFIGYMYGLYTDIPMTYLLISPYIEPFDETPDANGAIKSSYWGSCDFKTAEGTDLPTFLEFLEKYRTVLLDISSGRVNLGNETRRYNDYQNLIADLDEILKDTEDLFKSISGETGQEIGGTVNIIKPITNRISSDNWYRLFQKTDDNTNIVLKWDAEIANRLYNKIKNINSTYAEYLGTETISQNLITELYSRTDGSVENKLTLITTLSAETNQIRYNTNNQERSLNITADDFGVLKSNANNRGVPLDKCYIFGLDVKKRKTKLTTLKERFKAAMNQLYDNAARNAANVFEENMGFRMSIENIFRMIFAHLQCFLHEYIDRTITPISTSTTRHVVNDFGIKLDDTDITSNDDNPSAPPFFAFYEGREQQRILGYPGDASYGNTTLQTIHEVELVDRLLNAAKIYRETFDSIRRQIEELTIQIEGGTESETYGASTINTFRPLTVYEALFGDVNPYTNLNSTYLNSLGNDKIYHILYHAGLRLYIADRLSDIKDHILQVEQWKVINDDVIEREANNIIEIFPDISVRNLDYERLHTVVADKILNYNGFYANPDSQLLASSQIDTTDSNIVANREEYVNTHPTNMLNYYTDGVKYYNTNVYDIMVNTYNSHIKDILTSTGREKTFYSYNTTQDHTEGTNDIPQNAVNKLYKVTDIQNGTGKEYEGNVGQLPNSELGIYTVPFLLWLNQSNDNVQNMLQDATFNGITNKYVKAFFILLSLTVSEIGKELSPTSDAYGLVYTTSPGNVLTVHEKNIATKLVKIRYVTALFFGALLYAYRNIEELGINSDFYKNKIINTDKKFNGDLIKTNTQSWVLKYPKEFNEDSTSENKSRMLSGFVQKILRYNKNVISDLEQLFIDSVDTPNNDLNVILSTYISDISGNSITYNKDIDKINLRSGFGTGEIDSYGEGIFNGWQFLKNESNTSKRMVEMLTRMRTLLITKKRRLDRRERGFPNEAGITSSDLFKDYFKKTYIEALVGKLETMVTEPTDNTDTSDTQTRNTRSNDIKDLKKSLYYTLKNLYDKWICSYGNMERFKLPAYEVEKQYKIDKYIKGENPDSVSEINNFIFVDAFYKDISSDFLVNPDTLIEIIEQTLTSRQYNFSVYQFMASVCEKNKLLMRSLPVYNNFTNADSLKNIFKPNDIFNAKNPQENNFSPTYLIMYTHQQSAHLNVSTQKGINYRNDGFDLGGTIAPKQFETCNDDKHINYKVPAFGVTYGMQNQNYFKSININMDNPITTDYAILNQLQLAERAVSGDLQHPIGIGQNIYSIYSNRSYNCTVEMLGCANIMPMMYFQLNNIPMFKGAYMIVSVKHSIKNGSMTTIFTGVRQSSALQGFTTENYLLSRITDVINENVPNNNGNNAQNNTQNNNCGTYDMTWAENMTI
jgi:hypothetical protein